MSRADADAANRELLLGMTATERRKMLTRLSDRKRKALEKHWNVWAHEGQIAPEGPWHTWMIMAGRGFGKTRAGAEWVRKAAQDPTARIALVAASLGEARRVMVEGESGLLAISPRGKRPLFEPSRRSVTWASGAQAIFYSASEPESLRGPQHSHARRSGAEGIHRQRGVASRRFDDPMRRRRRSSGPTGEPFGGPDMARRRRPDRRLRRPRRGDCRLDRIGLALRRGRRRSVRVRQVRRLLPAFR